MVEPTDQQKGLLVRMRRRPLVLSGEETDEERLSLLQLYASGLITQSTSRKRLNAMEWRLTNDGRAAVRALELRRGLPLKHRNTVAAQAAGAMV
jgi:hypothetical protein